MPRLLDHVNFPKVVTVLAVTFGVALGACGLTALVGRGDTAMTFGIVELAVMVLSAIGLIVAVIVWIIVTAIGDRGGGTPKLFVDADRQDR